MLGGRVAEMRLHHNSQLVWECDGAKFTGIKLSFNYNFKENIYECGMGF
jgi:hypothetical protein